MSLRNVDFFKWSANFEMKMFAVCANSTCNSQ